jgi:hypothetical protein
MVQNTALGNRGFLAMETGDQLTWRGAQRPQPEGAYDPLL